MNHVRITNIFDFSFDDGKANTHYRISAIKSYIHLFLLFSVTFEKINYKDGDSNVVILKTNYKGSPVYITVLNRSTVGVQVSTDMFSTACVFFCCWITNLFCNMCFIINVPPFLCCCGGLVSFFSKYVHLFTFVLLLICFFSPKTQNSSKQCKIIFILFACSKHLDHFLFWFPWLCNN